MRIWEPGWKKIGSGMEKIRIRDKHPDPQHCKKRKFLVRGGECPTVKYLKGLGHQMDLIIVVMHGLIKVQIMFVSGF